MSEKISTDQSKDAGLALVLILLLLVLLGDLKILLLPAVLCLVLVMAAPTVFRFWGRAWFAFSHLLGSVVSKVLLTVVFFVVVVPVGVLRRLNGKDPMRITQWKQGTGSVFDNRNCTVTRTHIERPY